MEDDESVPEEELITSFRTLLHRAISFLQREEENLEQEMIDVAIENSLDTYRESLFTTDHNRRVSLNPSILEQDMEDECHLCLENMKKGDHVIILPCKHTFHSLCLHELVVHQHIQCPLCRNTIPIGTSPVPK